ncbi:helix-turn-helix transcriptional regulator [Mariniluteicoccus flavus]
MNMEYQKMLDVNQAAALTRQSTNTLAYFRHVGKGPKFGKLGRRVFYREADVLAWIDAQFEKGGAA